MILIACWCIVCLLAGTGLSQSLLQATSTGTVPVSDGFCSYEEIIERKRQAVKVQLLAKLDIRSLPNNTRSDIPDDVLKQISRIYQEVIRDDQEKGDRQRDESSRWKSSPKAKHNLIFPEPVRELGSNTFLYQWSADAGGLMVDKAEVHLPLELTVPSLRIYIVNSPATNPAVKLRREDTERLFGDKVIDITKHWRRWALDPTTNHGILFCVGRCYDDSKSVEMFGSKPYITVEILAVDNRRIKRSRNSSPQTCTKFPNQCCYKDHYITFKELGLDHTILEPRNFNAGLCLGICNEMWMEQYYHSHIMSYSEQTNVRTCCAPANVSGLRVIYYDYEQEAPMFVMLPNMIVTSCSCK